ncbi:membrane protein insertion efficiency factor YidD [Yinghuangia sp. YIM S09857]|uniref:membrane protein insertion efficiency factor YidD n=1 Tax=Yinghuangia sp. YIM S09857 TaxID=3436929 RepID=UPI003F52FDCC
MNTGNPFAGGFPQPDPDDEENQGRDLSDIADAVSNGSDAASEDTELGQADGGGDAGGGDAGGSADGGGGDAGGSADGGGGDSSCGDGCDCGGCDCGLLIMRLQLRLLAIALACLLRPARGREARLDARMLRAVHRYRNEVSPKRPPCCRYTPTCSTYAVTALERHGAARGALLTLRRLHRCRPSNPAKRGLDPVPE